MCQCRYEDGRSVCAIAARYWLSADTGVVDLDWKTGTDTDFLQDNLRLGPTVDLMIHAEGGASLTAVHQLVHRRPDHLFRCIPDFQDNGRLHLHRVGNHPGMFRRQDRGDLIEQERHVVHGHSGRNKAAAPYDTDSDLKPWLNMLCLGLLSTFNLVESGGDE